MSGLLLKFPTSLIPDEAEITYYADATDLDYEGEMVLIIGKTARNVPKERAAEYIFAVAPGNDVSERVWQGGDLQMVPREGRRYLGPVGPVMVAVSTTPISSWRHGSMARSNSRSGPRISSSGRPRSSATCHMM